MILPDGSLCPEYASYLTETGESPSREVLYTHFERLLRISAVNTKPSPTTYLHVMQSDSLELLVPLVARATRMSTANSLIMLQADACLVCLPPTHLLTSSPPHLLNPDLLTTPPPHHCPA